MRHFCSICSSLEQIERQIGSAQREAADKRLRSLDAGRGSLPHEVILHVGASLKLIWAAGPVGAIVGGTVGGVVGGVAGVLGVDQRPRFHRYVVEERRPSYRYEGDVRVGAVLPEAGITYYEVPPEYGVHEYRYTVVNDRPVLVDPRTRRIVEIVE
jgi:hypothetical protein